MKTRFVAIKNQKSGRTDPSPGRHLQERFDRMTATQRNALVEFVDGVLSLKEGDAVEETKQSEVGQYVS